MEMGRGWRFGLRGRVERLGVRSLFVGKGK